MTPTRIVLFLSEIHSPTGERSSICLFSSQNGKGRVVHGRVIKNFAATNNSLEGSHFAERNRGPRVAARMILSPACPLRGFQNLCLRVFENIKSTIENRTDLEYIYLYIYIYACIYTYACAHTYVYVYAYLLFFSQHSTSIRLRCYRYYITFYTSFLLASLFCCYYCCYSSFIVLLLCIYNDTYIYYIYIYISFLSLRNSKPSLCVISSVFFYDTDCHVSAIY